MAKKVLTAQEWAEKWVEWNNGRTYDGAKVSVDDILQSFQNNSISPQRIPSVKKLKEIEIEVYGDTELYQGRLFLEDINIDFDDENMIPSPDILDLDGVFSSLSFVECYLDIPICCDATSTGGDSVDDGCTGGGDNGDEICDYVESEDLPCPCDDNNEDDVPSQCEWGGDNEDVTDYPSI